MDTFQVDDMTCRHCAETIRTALAALDPAARIDIDVAARRVQVESARAGAAQLQATIAQAGYTPVAIQSSAPAAGQGAAGGCGCGGCGCSPR
jgi:copper chaperone